MSDLQGHASLRASWGLVVLLVAGGASVAIAAPPASGGNKTGGIYSCVDANGRRQTSDRPIVACIGIEQRILNSDGSVRQVVPPSMTAEERAQAEEDEKRNAAEKRTKRDVARRDQNLVQRYPDEPTHSQARKEALDDVRRAVRRSESRLIALAAERRPLDDEGEFYLNRPLPPQLKAALDANDASTEAQRVLVMYQQSEIKRINATFDLELQRLRKLWAGARPGSLGPLETVSIGNADAKP